MISIAFFLQKKFPYVSIKVVTGRYWVYTYSFNKNSNAKEIITRSFLDGLSNE